MRQIASVLFIIISFALCGGSATAFWHGSSGLPLTNWTVMNLGGGGNVSGLAISAQGVRMVRGDVFNDSVFGTDNTWHNLSTAAGMPAANFNFYPATNTNVNQNYVGYSGVMEIAPCPSSASCGYKYAGGWVFYSGNISTSNDSEIYCNTGFTKTADTANNVISATDPGQFMAVDPYDSSHVYVGTPAGVLFESFNADAEWDGTRACSGTTPTWTPVSTASIPASARTIQGHSVPGYAIAFDPTGGSTTRSTHTVAAKVYIFSAATSSGTAGVYSSSDGGATWSLTTSGPSDVQHIKVSAASAGGGNVWAVNFAGTVFALNGSACTSSCAWTTALTGAGIWDVAINPDNGNQIAATLSDDSLDVSTNGAVLSPTPTFTNYTGAAVAGDSPWLITLAVTGCCGGQPGAIEFDPLHNGTLIATMGQGVWTTTFPNANFTWLALSSGIQGAVFQNAVTSISAGVVAAGAQDVSGCTFAVATASTPRSTCFPTGAYDFSNGLLFSVAQDLVPGTSTVFAKIGPDSGFAPDLSGYTTDKFSTYTPYNLWNTRVASTAIGTNGGKVQITVGATASLNAWAAGDAITRNSIVCLLTSMPHSLAVGLDETCDEIGTVDSSTTFTLKNTTFSSSMATTGYTYTVYVPAPVFDDGFGYHTINSVTNSGGAILVGAPSGAATLAPVCISGATAPGMTLNGCWTIAPNGTLAGSTFAGSYTSGGILGTYGQNGGSVAAATASNISQVNGGSVPYCTTNGGASWTAMHVSGEAGAGSGVTTTGTASAGATTVGVTGTPSPFTLLVLLASGRWYVLGHGSVAGSTLTFPNPIPPGDSLASGSTIYDAGSGGGYVGGNTATSYLELDIARDWITPNTFYAVNRNLGLIKWTNCGTPTVIAAESANTGWLTDWSGGQILKTVPGQAGHMFFTVGADHGTTHPAGKGFYRVCNGTQSSATVQQVTGFFEVYSFGFGAVAPGQSYPRIYVIGWYDSGSNQNTAQYGIWESTNDPNNGATGACTLTGNTWTNVGTITQNAQGGFPLGWANGSADINGDLFTTGATDAVYTSNGFFIAYGVFN